MYNMTPEERDKSQKRKDFNLFSKIDEVRPTFSSFNQVPFFPSLVSTSDSSYVEVSKRLAE